MIRWTRWRPRNGLEALGGSALFGLALLGTADLALSLTGLLFPTLVVAVPLAGILFAGSPRHSLLASSFHDLARAPLAWRLIGLAILVMFAAIVATQRVDEDALVYHLGYPWQSLLAHRFVASWVPFIFHTPLMIDQTYVLPIVLGEDRLAKWTIVAAFLAAALFIIGRAAADRRGPAGWITLLLILSTNWVLEMPALPKNDLAAAALFVVGAIVWRGGSWSAGAFLLGASVAAKLTTGPFVFLWVVVHPPRKWSHSAAASLLLLPLLPWLVKTWILLCNPIHPAAWSLFRTDFWNARNQVGLDQHMHWIPNDARVFSNPLVWVSVMWHGYPLLLVTMPWLALTPARRTVLVMTLASLLEIRLGGHPRYLLPGAWLLAVEIGALAGRARAPGGTWLRGALGGVAVVQLLLNPWFRVISWTAPLESSAGIRRAALTTYAVEADRLRQLRIGRVLLAGAWRTYLLPSRGVFNGYWGETPAVWELVKTSGDQRDLRKRFRQLGTGVILENVISVDAASWLQTPFGWDDRMLRLYGAFCRERLAVLDSPTRIDRANGGFYLLRLDLTDHPRSAGPLLFLPGAETALWVPRNLAQRRLSDAAARAFAHVLACTGPVGYFVTHQAYAETLAGHWRLAFEQLRPFVEAGLTDGYNLPTFGMAAATLHRHREAIAALLRCTSLYDNPEKQFLNLASTCQDLARLELHRGHAASARSALDQADRALAHVPESPGPDAENRRLTQALILGSRGDLSLACGRMEESAEFYRQAFELAPTSDNARRWSQMLASRSHARP